MRKSAYIKAIQQAMGLPSHLPEMKAYFNDAYDPRAAAIEHILDRARKDTGALFHFEFIEVYNASRATGVPANTTPQRCAIRAAGGA